VAVRGEFGGRAADPGGAEVLDALDGARPEEVEAALDEHLLREGVAHLDRRPLGRLRGVERFGGEDRGAADPVAARAGAEEDDPVAGAGGVRQPDVLVPQHAHGERVYERVALVAGVEDGLAADARRAQTVAVAADAAPPTGQRARRGGAADRAAPQPVPERE